ncbi:MAG TPA: hypothetical protein PLE74_01100 [Candidatus Cloacimonadota bacterium]|nr:hypothetical protein [Candidatus Cloacimonadota bacterium]
MILGSSINWKPFLVSIKSMDSSIIRKHTDELNNPLDYTSFIKICNEAFPGTDARELIYCTDVFEVNQTPMKNILLINNFLIVRYNKGFVCLTGNLVQWRDFVDYFLLCRIDESISERCIEYKKMLKNIDKDMF